MLGEVTDPREELASIVRLNLYSIDLPCLSYCSIADTRPRRLIKVSIKLGTCLQFQKVSR